MPEQPPEIRRVNTVLERILQFLNDAVNKSPSEIALLAELRAQLLVARKAVAEQGLSERDALIQALSAAPSFEQLERDIAQEEQAPALPDAPPPQREVYTLADARAVLADSQIMAEQLFSQRTGRQPDRATRTAIGRYLLDNLLSGQRGAPTNPVEEFTEQVVALQGETITRFPLRATADRRLGSFFNALLDSDNPSAQIDQDTYNALVFPTTPLVEIPARFRAGGPSEAKIAEQKALGALNTLSTNMLTNLQKSVDVAGGPTGVTNFSEAAGRIVSEQTEEDVLAGTNTLPAVDSPSEIRARQRDAEALATLEDVKGIKKAVTAQVGDPELETDPGLKKDKAQAIRLAASRIEERRREILQSNPGISDTDLNAQLAPAMGQEVAAFDQTLATVSQESAARKFVDLDSVRTELKDILGREGLNASEIDDDLLTQVAQFVMESENPAQTAQSVVGAFSGLQQESERLRTVGDLALAKKRIADALGEAGLDVGEITDERLTQIAAASVRAGRLPEAQGLVDAFPMFAREAANLEFVEGGAGAITERLEHAAGFRFPDLPGREEAVQRLADTIRFRVQREPFADVDRLLQSAFQPVRPDLEAFGAPQIAGEPDEGPLTGPIFDPDFAPDNPLLRAVFERLRFEPTGGGLISPMDAAVIAGTPGARQRFGAAPPTLPGLPPFNFANVRSQTETLPPEAPPGFGVLAPLFREAAGENVPLLQFLFQQTPQLQEEFLAGRRAEVRRGRREARGEFQTLGRGLSEGLGAAKSALAAVGGVTGPGGEQIEAERARLRRQLDTLRFFGPNRPSRPKGTFEDFFGSRVEGLRERFSQTPAGLQEELRLESQAESDARRAEVEARRVESEAERDRRRLLRGGGRTMFQRIGA
jgi:hypothetical protein